MIFAFSTIVGFLGGMFCVFIAMETRRLRIMALMTEQRIHERQLAEQIGAFSSRQGEAAARASESESRLKRLTDELSEKQAKFDSRAISYKELQDENLIIKRDLRNLEIERRKLEVDGNTRDGNHRTISERSEELCRVYLKDNVKWITSSLNANNFSNCKQRLLAVVARCREIGVNFPETEEAKLIADLRTEYEKAVRAAFQREEQQRIKAQIREEQLRQRDIDREREQAERECEAIRNTLAKARAEAADENNAEIEHLKARLAEAEGKSRAISQAQLTKAGHVYVISNIGSFGDGVFKIGMTRRLDPSERVKELGSASVPFPFDVHVMISADDAPSLEASLHQKLHKSRINKANPRKEFFKTDIDAIVTIVKEHHGDVQYVADAEALQFHQSLTMPDEDQEYIERVYSGFDDDEDLVDIASSA
jgi:Meiotically up-regulated gene 113